MSEHTHMSPRLRRRWIKQYQEALRQHRDHEACRKLILGYLKHHREMLRVDQALTEIVNSEFRGEWKA